jgi:SAM-dependent methyltransferase
MQHTADAVLALDVIEHLNHPELGVTQIHSTLKAGGVLYASTANVAFFPLRVMLLLGFFNYGRKGILDKTHKRLFTISSFQRLLRQAGFQISSVRGFGPPIASLRNGKSLVLNLLDRIASCLAKWWPSLFAYEFLVIATRTEDIKTLLEKTTKRNFTKEQ